MADPIADIIGDYRAFAAQQSDRLATRGIDSTPYPLSHLAYRVPEWDQYVHVRSLLERHAVASVENVVGTALGLVESNPTGTTGPRTCSRDRTAS